MALVAPALAAGTFLAGSGAAGAPPQARALEPVAARESLPRLAPPPLQRIPAAAAPAPAHAPRWAPEGMRTALMRCRHEPRAFCDGPRRMPRPHGEAAARARSLELGTYYAGSKLLRSAPRRRWMEAARELGVEPARRLLWPVQGAPFGRGFGRVPDRPHVLHDGVDVAADEGRFVRAVADGLVAYADNAIRGLGNVVMVLHGGSAVAVYAHLREGRVVAGERVRRGQVLGRVGSTGLTRGPHLHFEWRVAGRPVDPAPMFER